MQQTHHPSMERGSARGTLRMFPRMQMLLLLLGLAGLTISRGQEASQAITVTLEPAVAVQPLTHLGINFVPNSAPSGKEPAGAKGPVARGTFKLLNDEKSYAYLWDRAGRTLILDLNGNNDLTDDPKHVSATGLAWGDRNATFTNLQFTVTNKGKEQQMVGDLQLYHYGQMGGSLGVRSYWQGKMTLAGKDLQVGLIGRVPESAHDGLAYVLLRPWEDRTKAVSTSDSTLQTVNCRNYLTYAGQDIHLEFEGLEKGAVKLVVSAGPKEMEWGSINFTGKHVARLSLSSNDRIVIVDSPAGTLKVPVGSYAANVYLKSGDKEATRAYSSRPSAGTSVVVAKEAVAVLAAGGPLRNMVTTEPRGRVLLLNYSLAGADGAAYQLVGARGNPTFRAYSGDKEIASGKFEFG